MDKNRSRIAGFTIIRNAVINDYPIIEAIRSILPVVDEMVVSVDPGDDETASVIQSIQSDKIRIVFSHWNMKLRKGGEVLAIETDKAFAEISPEMDWAFYIQADEVVHEKYHPAILEATQRYLHDKRVEGLLFNYTHFYGTYDYVGDSRRWYSKEIRIIRNDKSIKAYRDAQGFRKNGQKLWVKPIDAWMFHYGWVKNPFTMEIKRKNMGYFWLDDETLRQQYIESGGFFDYSSEIDSIKKFTGTHPAVMAERIHRQNWQVHLDPNLKRFNLKGRLHYFIERKTGKRLFEYKNYRILRA